MTRFRRNPAFERELRAQPRFQAGLEETTTAVAVVVRETAPRKTGFYRRHVRPQGTKVVAADPFAHLVEFGSVNNPVYAPLRRGARAAGLRVDETPR